MPFEKINSKVVRIAVTPQQAVLARRGAMLGYNGQVAFRPISGQGQGVGGMVGALAWLAKRHYSWSLLNLMPTRRAAARHEAAK